MLLLDTDVLIEVQRGSEEAAAWLKSLKGSMGIPAAVAWEMLIGARNKVELQKSQHFISTFAVIQIDESDSLKVAELIVKHGLKSGSSLGDYLNASQALCRNATLFSFNLKHYRSVAGLDVRVPYER